jgi:hypothetical protein
LLHDHHGKNTKSIKTLIYICISPYAHTSNLKLAATTLITLKGYGEATLVQTKFSCKTGTAAVRDHEITTRRADVAEPSLCRRTRRGSRQCSCSRPPCLHVRIVLVLQTYHVIVSSASGRLLDICPRVNCFGSTNGLHGFDLLGY